MSYNKERIMADFHTKILVFTDIHIVDEGDRIIGIDPYERFREGLSHALSCHPDAARVVLMGDLAHHGRTTQYARLAELLKDVPVPVNLMMGNHDNRHVFLRQFPETELTREGYVQHMVDLGDTCLITLDTLDPTATPHHAGRLCEDRLAWLDRALVWAGGRQLIVALHHPPFKTGFIGMDNIALQDPGALRERLTDYAGEVHLLCGHVHRTVSGRAHGLSFTLFKSPCHQIPMVLNDASTSHSSDEPGAYGIVLAGPDGIIAHSEDFAIAAAAPPQHDPFSS